VTQFCDAPKGNEFFEVLCHHDWTQSYFMIICQSFWARIGVWAWQFRKKVDVLAMCEGRMRTAYRVGGLIKSY
jgi:hypothetical protein